MFNIFSIIITVILIFAIILLFFYVCSYSERKSAALCAFFMMLCLFAVCYLNIQKKIVVNLKNESLKVVNISYYCPGCNQYIASIETKFCSRCGKNLEYVKKEIGEINGNQNH